MARDESGRSLDDLLAQVRACRACEAHLPLGPRPVVQAGAAARILIVGQAPGARVHASGIPWDDRSGARLREWMGIDAEHFYDPARVAIVPMGFCYPGRGPSGDLPPRLECAPLWQERLIAQLPKVELTLLVGAYAQTHHLRRTGHTSVTRTMLDWRANQATSVLRTPVFALRAAVRAHAPGVIPLPHPSPRNIAWFKANPWFDDELLPVLRQSVRKLIGG
jgi:uracil-DNA glycosylase